MKLWSSYRPVRGPSRYLTARPSTPFRVTNRSSGPAARGEAHAHGALLGPHNPAHLVGAAGPHHAEPPEVVQDLLMLAQGQQAVPILHAHHEVAAQVVVDAVQELGWRRPLLEEALLVGRQPDIVESAAAAPVEQAARVHAADQPADVAVVVTDTAQPADEVDQTLRHARPASCGFPCRHRVLDLLVGVAADRARRRNGTLALRHAHPQELRAHVRRGPTAQQLVLGVEAGRQRFVGKCGHPQIRVRRALDLAVRPRSLHQRAAQETLRLVPGSSGRAQSAAGSFLEDVEQPPLQGAYGPAGPVAQARAGDAVGQAEAQPTYRRAAESGRELRHAGPSELLPDLACPAHAGPERREPSDQIPGAVQHGRNGTPEHVASGPVLRHVEQRIGRARVVGRVAVAFRNPEGRAEPAALATDLQPQEVSFERSRQLRCSGVSDPLDLVRPQEVERDLAGLQLGNGRQPPAGFRRQRRSAAEQALERSLRRCEPAARQLRAGPHGRQGSRHQCLAGIAGRVGQDVADRAAFAASFARKSLPRETTLAGVLCSVAAAAAVHGAHERGPGVHRVVEQAEGEAIGAASQSTVPLVLRQAFLGRFDNPDSRGRHDTPAPGFRQQRLHVVGQDAATLRLQKQLQPILPVGLLKDVLVCGRLPQLPSKAGEHVRLAHIVRRRDLVTLAVGTRNLVPGHGNSAPARARPHRGQPRCQAGQPTIIGKGEECGAFEHGEPPRLWVRRGLPCCSCGALAAVNEHATGAASTGGVA
jgi:hypothetical protein